MTQPTQPSANQPSFQPAQQAPPQQYQQQPQPPVKKAKRFGWVAMAITAAVALGIGGAVGSSGDGTTTAGPATTTTVTATATATKTVLEESEPTEEPTTQAPKPTKKAAPSIATTMEDGTYEIGVDAKAGRYKTIAEDGCYWERDKDDSGEFDSIIANDNVSDGARASVTVKKGEFFQSEGCGTWKLT
jgi:hypothetical protein